MSENLAKPHKSKLLSLFVPIFLETLFLMLAGIADTLMLSSVSDQAVGAVGTANTYVGMFFILFAIMSSGLIAVMTQYIGLGKKGVAFQARQLAILINGGIGIVLAILLIVLSEPIIGGLGIAESMKVDAVHYMRIVGGGCLLDALIPVFSTYLRAFDKAKFSLAAAFSGNVVNVLCNTLVLFVIRPADLVSGIAAGTLIGKGVNLLLCFLFGWFLIKGRQFDERIERKQILKDIIRVGFPAAAETAIYTAAMAAVMAILNRTDTTGFGATAKAYAQQITNLAYCVSFAFSQANVILVGWAIGEGKAKECYKPTYWASLIAIGASVVFEAVLAAASPGILRAFTSDEAMILTVRNLLLIDIALEVGRAANLVYGYTLKSTGDSIFPAAITAVFNLLFAVGGALLFGYVMNLKVVGIFIGLTLDECVRAVLMWLRWRSGKWEGKVLVKAKEEDKGEPSLQ